MYYSCGGYDNNLLLICRTSGLINLSLVANKFSSSSNRSSHTTLETFLSASRQSSESQSTPTGSPQSSGKTLFNSLPSDNTLTPSTLTGSPRSIAKSGKTVFNSLLSDNTLTPSTLTGSPRSIAKSGKTLFNSLTSDNTLTPSKRKSQCSSFSIKHFFSQVAHPDSVCTSPPSKKLKIDTRSNVIANESMTRDEDCDLIQTQSDQEVAESTDSSHSNLLIKERQSPTPILSVPGQNDAHHSSAFYSRNDSSPVKLEHSTCLYDGQSLSDATQYPESVFQDTEASCTDTRNDITDVDDWKDFEYSLDSMSPECLCVCEVCSLKVPVWEWQEHCDYHLALKLQEECQEEVGVTAESSTMNKANKKKRKSASLDLLDLFRKK